MTARVLTSLGYWVLQASGGIEAMRIVQRHEGTIDLLATDIVMPSIGGHDLVHLLSAMHSGITVLFLSCYTGDEAGLGELGLGNAFQQKPVDPKVVARKVRPVLDGHLVNQAWGLSRSGLDFIPLQQLVPMPASGRC